MQSLPFTATALTPVHIGGGPPLTAQDFVVVREGVAVFDAERFLATHPAREGAFLEALAAVDPASGELSGLDRALLPAEQSAADLHRYLLPASDFVASRLRGLRTDDKPGKPSPAAQPATPVRAAPRTDLRGGLGGRVQLSLPHLPTAAPTPAKIPTPAATAVAARSATSAAKSAPTPLAAGKDAPETPGHKPSERLLSPHVKLSDDAVYLPGSAIKGALRTALLHDLIRNRPGCLEGFLDEMIFAARNGRPGPRALDEELSVLLRPEGPGSWDVLSALGVGDTAGLRPGAGLGVEMVRFASPRTGPEGWPMPPEVRPPDRGRGPGGFGGGGPQGRGGPGRGGLGGGLGGPGFGAGLGGGDRGGAGARAEMSGGSLRGPAIYVEAVRAKTAFTGSAFLSDEQLDLHGGRRGLPDDLRLGVPMLCKAANGLARKVLERELHWYRSSGPDFVRVHDFCRDLAAKVEKADDRTAYVSLGWGAGWHRTTVGILLDELAPEVFAEVRRRFNLAPHRLLSRFPKTRRLAMDGFLQPRCPLGWVELKFG